MKKRGKATAVKQSASDSAKKAAAKGKGLDDDRAVAYDFSVKAYKLFKEIIKSIVLFGSVPKKEVNVKSDIDIVVIIDDATVKWDDELIAWYREELAKLLAAEPYSKRLHVNTVTMTTFWEEARVGEPVTINVLRYGEALVDHGGFFEPMKAMLAKGKIRPTPEAVFVTMERAHAHAFQGNNNILASIEAFYWAMVDASHSALMAARVVPPSPEFIAELITETFVATKRVDKKYVEWFEEMRFFAKKITYGDIKRMDGKQVEILQKKADEFVTTFTNIAKAIIQNEKIVRVEYKNVA